MLTHRSDYLLRELTRSYLVRNLPISCFERRFSGPDGQEGGCRMYQNRGTQVRWCASIRLRSFTGLWQKQRLHRRIRQDPKASI